MTLQKPENKLVKIILALLAVIVVFMVYSFMPGKEHNAEFTRTEQLFNSGWTFSMQEQDQNSRKINLPHTTRIEPLVVNDQWQGTAWYEKEFEFEPREDQKVFLEFEAVMHEADVWLNDEKLTTHLGGYLPFCVDITDHLENGKNILKVKVNNEDNSEIPPGKPLKDLDFNYYGGIYRDVKLITTNRIHVTNAILENKPASGGLLVHFSEISQTSAKGLVKVHAANGTNKEIDLKVKISLSNPEGNIVEKSSKTVRVKPNGKGELQTIFSVENPKLWSTIAPNLYNLKVELFADGTKVDQLNQKTGIRKIELNSDGFFLNDEKLYIRGTNRHQEYPYVGYAISDDAHYRDAIKIKQAGFDFVRLSHYPQDDAFLDACDELGILVMDAIPGWQFYGDGEFVKNSYQDISDMVRKDRNHPSVVFWEVSLNESGMTEEYMINANRILQEELPFGDTYSAGWIDHPSFDFYIPARQHSKAPDYWTKYNKKERQIFISEYGDWEYYAQNAGFNQSAFEGLKKEERTSRQLRESGEKRLLQQALNFQEAANSNCRGVNTIGHANWVMFDYNRGYADDLESSGISDIFRLPKFAYYFYQSQRPPSERVNFRGTNIGGTMIKIASFWNEDSPTDLKVFSNCEEVALYLNDSLIARKKSERDQYSSHLDYPPFKFSLGIFTGGTLMAKGYIQGEEVCKDLVSTAGSPDRVMLEIDKSGMEISKEQSDVLILNASVVDANGNLVSNDSSLIQFNLKNGNAELIGENPARAKAGVASILIKTSGGGGMEGIVVSASSESINSHELVIP